MTRYIYLLLCLSFLACTEVVEVDLEKSDEIYLVVYGEITNISQAHEVRLTTTAPYLSSEATPAVSGAQVEIHWVNESISLTESDTQPGSYSTPDDFAANPLVSYSLHISQVDINADGVMEDYTASDRSIPAMPIDSIRAEYEFNVDNEIFIRVGLFAQEPPETTNYFCFRLAFQHEPSSEVSIITDRLSEWFVTDDRYFSGMNFNGAAISYTNEGEMEGISYTLEDSIILEARSVSKAFYEFASAAQTASGGGIPLFSGPAANVPTNLSAGALGFFSVQILSSSKSGLVPVEE